MRILITNDDGINAPGLAVLDEIANALAGEDGEVWTVAPAFEQSGVGHCISYTRPMMISKMAERRYAAEGTPAACVFAGLQDVMKDAPPDLVLSGVNRGNNAAENAVYSGTVGAAMEAALQGVPAVALSQYYGPKNRDLDDTFEAARVHGFPTLPAAEVKGLRAARQGFRRDIGFGVQPHTSPSGRRFLWVTGAPQHEPTSPGSDADVNLQGYISVTPMRADLTAHDALEALKAIE